MKNLDEYLQERSKLFILFLGLSLTALLGFADYFTGSEVSVTLFYLIPIFLSTWYAGEKTGIFMSFFSSATWLLAGFLVAGDSHSAILYWNAIAILATFLIFTFILSVLRDGEQRLWSTIQGSQIPTFVIGKDHRVIYWNRALEKLSTIKAKEVVGTREHWRAFYRSKRPCMADLMVDGALETVPDWYSGKYSKSPLIDEAYEATDFFPELGDEGRWLRFTAAAIRNAEGELVGAIETLEDVTERRRAEDELSKIKKLESLGHFADGVAHDFDNLLSAMLRNIFLAKISADEEDKVLEEALTIAEKAGLQAKELAHRLITFAKGGYSQRRVTSIAQMIQETTMKVLSGSPVQCRFSIAGDLRPVEVDEPQIERVIQNIVLNAREAMPEGGAMDVVAQNITVKGKGDVSLKEGDYLKLSFKDRGVGITKEHLSRIFDPYYTTKETKGQRGSGLGLAVCYSIVKNHQGLITVDSDVGRGTTVHVFLPAAQGSIAAPVSDKTGD